MRDWHAGTTEAEDEIYLEFTLDDGTEIGWFMEYCPSTVALSKEGKVYRVRVRSLEHLSQLLNNELDN
jgi:hypothetical protein